jgi:hypothetical protein
MSTVSVYDIASGSWFEQETNGQPPGATTQGCAVVASAQDGSSHSIYWYGGFDGIGAGKAFSDDVYILSIPSFMWMRVAPGTDSHGRAGHRCVKPYPDQMLVIGGYTPTTTNGVTCLSGGVVQAFNLSSLKWMDAYDPSVWSNYSIPEMISAMIGGDGRGGADITAPTTWSNTSMAALFAAPYDNTKIKNWYPFAASKTVSINPTVNTTQSSLPTATSTTPTADSSSTPTWLAPVLGVVLGLVFFSTLVVLILLWRRRRLLRKQSQTSTDHRRILSWVRGADEKSAGIGSDNSSAPPYEEVVESPLSRVVVSEAASNEVHEMPGKLFSAFMVLQPIC